MGSCRRRAGRASHGHVLPGLLYQAKEVTLFLMGGRKPMKVFKQERKIIRFYFGIVTLVVI